MIGIVIPARNEEACIESTLVNIARHVKEPHIVYVIDDHSEDRTRSAVLRHSDHWISLKWNRHRVVLVSNRAAPGFGNALRCGYALTRNYMYPVDAVVTMMADGCDDPCTVNVMWDKMILGSFDIVCGSRYHPLGGRIEGDLDGPSIKGWLSKAAGRSLYLLGLPTSDATNAFKMYRFSLLNKLHTKSLGFSISIELLARARARGAMITEVPTVWRGRTTGNSKFNFLKGLPAYARWYCAVCRKSSNEDSWQDGRTPNELR